MRIGIMTSDLGASHAGPDALSMLQALADAGEDCFLFSRSGGNRAAAGALDYADAPLVLSRGDILIYHFTGPDEPAEAIMRRLECEIVLRLHTAEERFLDPASSVSRARRQKLAREMLARMRDRRTVDAWVGPDIDPLLASAITRLPCSVVPQFTAATSLLDAQQDGEAKISLLPHWLNLLLVAPITPGSGIEGVIHAFRSASELAIPKAHLHIAGDLSELDEDYFASLNQLIAELNLSGAITWHRTPTPGRLAALYSGADIFWAPLAPMPAHIAPALAFGLPVVGQRTQALSAIVGDGARLAASASDLIDLVAVLAYDAQARSEARRAARQAYLGKWQPKHTAAQIIEALNRTRAMLRQPIGPVIDADDEWFGIPDAIHLVRAALDAAPDTPAHELNGEDRRRDFIGWALSIGYQRSMAVRQFVDSRAFADYAASIPVPALAAHLDAESRLAWFFDRSSHSTFDLKTQASVSAFLQWHRATSKVA